jgi:type II restriction enzyme
LNSLIHIKPQERKDKLRDIIIKYPQVLKVIPLIIAIKDKNLLVLEIGEKLLFRNFEFSTNRIVQKKLVSNENEIDNIVEFCDKSGILELFGRIKDLYTYMTGVEVGLDSNARKNRSGKIFEQIVELFLKRELQMLGHSYSLKCEDTSIKIGKSKRIDFVVYKSNNPLIAIECNF